MVDLEIWLGFGIKGLLVVVDGGRFFGWSLMCWLIVVEEDEGFEEIGIVLFFFDIRNIKKMKKRKR